MTNGNCPFLTVWATKMFMAVDMVMPIDLKVSSADTFKSSSILKLICAIVFSPLDAAYYTTIAFQRQASHGDLRYKTTVRDFCRITRETGGCLLDAFAEILGFGDELGAVDSAFFINAVDADHAARFAALVAGEESAQGGKRAVELRAICVRHREDVEVKRVLTLFDQANAVEKRLFPAERRTPEHARWRLGLPAAAHDKT